ncbi:MAG: hypothetical protein ACR2P0_03560, partial [Acidimicrobiales bacterium]
DALSARVEALEAALANGGVVAPTAPSSVSPAPAAEPEPSRDRSPEPTAPAAEPTAAEPARSGRPADMARAALRPRDESHKAAPPPPSMRDQPTAPARMPESAVETTPAEPEPDTHATEPEAQSIEDAQTLASVAPSGGSISIDDLRSGWEELLDGLATKTRARFRGGELVAISGNEITFGLRSEMERKRCEPFTAEVEGALSRMFGAPYSLRYTTDEPSNAPTGSAAAASSSTSEPIAQHEDEVDIHDLTDAEVGNNTVVDRIADVFPGAEVLGTPDS